MNINKFKVDTQKVNDGVWVDLGENARVKLARTTNKKYQEALSKKLKPYKNAMEAGNADYKAISKIIAECAADFIVLDWEGFTEGEKDLPYSRDKVIEILTTEEYKDFGEMLLNLAAERSTFQAEEEKEEMGKQSS